MHPFFVPHPFYAGTSKQSRQLDSDTIEQLGISGFTLMEVAGYSAARILLNILQPGQRGTFLCGKGNNAGDALVIARYLLQHGIAATLVFLSGTDDLSPDARTNLTLIQQIAAQDSEVAELLEIVPSWEEFDPASESDFIIDGMLGTGLSSDLRTSYAKAVAWANNSPAPVYAVDIPSGLNADSGAIMGSAINAGHTFAFGNLKQGYYLNKGPELTGEISYCELPFPNYLKKEFNTFVLDEAWVQPPSLKPAIHKYKGGVLYIIAGSEGLTGAAILASKSAWAEGLGAVILLCPKGILPVYEHNLPQIIKRPVGGRNDYYFSKQHLEEVAGILAEKEGTVLLGPGLGRQAETAHFVQAFLSSYQGRLSLDADGLWALAQSDSWSKPSGSEWILTPHPGELTNLLDVSIKDDLRRFNEVRAFAKQKNITLVSKGFPVMVGTPGGDLYLTSYDTRVFSRAGFGDILSGKIAAYQALGFPAEQGAAMALLKGKHKIDHIHILDADHIAEPLDLV